MKVVFRKDKENYITAVYLNEVNNYFKNELVCYSRVGQHGGCSIEWLYHCTKPAKLEEYAPLLEELRDYHGGDRLAFIVLDRLPKYSKIVRWFNIGRRIWG